MSLISHSAALAVVLALGLATVGVLAGQGPAPALINESPSLPEGLYLRTATADAPRGAVVAIRQPAAVRPYLAGLGVPADVRLLKRVAARGGDAVCSDGRWLIAPMRLVRIHAHDRAGAPLPAWRGCRLLAPDERLLLGDTPTSLDSRYFGPVTTARIEGVYREALAW